MAGAEERGRDYHGALLDAQLLVDVYLAMTGGQAALSLEAAPATVARSGGRRFERGGLALARIVAGPEEIAAHERQLDLLQKACPDGPLWRRLGA